MDKKCYPSLGGDAAAALNESLILGLLIGVASVLLVFVGDIGLDAAAPVAVARRSASSAETGGLVARGEGTEGVEMPRNAGTGGGGMSPAAADDPVAAATVPAGEAGGGEDPGGVGMAAELPPGGLNSA